MPPKGVSTHASMRPPLGKAVNLLEGLLQNLKLALPSKEANSTTWSSFPNRSTASSVNGIDSHIAAKGKSSHATTNPNSIGGSMPRIAVTFSSMKHEMGGACSPGHAKKS